MLFEEVASLNPEEGFIPGAPSLDEALKPLRANRATNSADRPNGNHGDDRNFKYVMEIYQQLKKNFENRGDDLTASDFYYGQMEMRRLPTLRQARLARWLARNLGLMGLYRKVSEYGESYWRPLVWVFVVAAIFTFVYPIFGLRRLPEKGKGGDSNSGQGNIATVTAPVLTFWQPMEGADEQGKKKCRLRMTLVGQSFMTSLGVAFFQRDIAVFEPTYPWGRMLQSLELTAYLCVSGSIPPSAGAQI